MNASEVPARESAVSNPSPAEAFETALGAVMGTVAAKLEHTAARWIGRLSAEGAKTHAHSAGLAWTAVKGAWQAGTPVVRAAIVTSVVAAVVLLVASPALLVVYLLSLLVIAAVWRSWAPRHRSGPSAA